MHPRKQRRRAWRSLFRSTNKPAGQRALRVEFLEPRIALSAQGLVDVGVQPQGSLDGKIVYIHGGHGWFADNPGPGNWDTQRGLTQGMVEDLGNVDQMTFLADYLFRAGATIVPLRPVGHQDNEVVLDNDDAGVTFTGAWSNSTATIYFGSAGDVPYRYASSSAVETATAKYTPTITEAGFYPVYEWTRAGTDRAADQLFRVHHSGGVTEVTVNHRMVGNGYVYLGTYHFEAGTSGYVEISNKSSEAGKVIIADSIRFGNGLGDIDRGGGVSGQSREDESGLYWVQWQVEHSQGIPTSTYRASTEDRDAAISFSPRYAAYMNQQAEGSLSDRVWVSFHSNATGGAPTGRGVLGLYNGNNTPSSATPNQFLLAKKLGQEVNDDMVAQDGLYEANWYNSGQNTTLDRSDIEFGEINNAYINNEFDATIVEVAYHDNPTDALLMRDPKVRDAVGRATYQGIVKYFNAVDAGATPVLMLPGKVTQAMAQSVGPGSVKVSWTAPAANVYNGDAPTGYRIYGSTNGYGFDGGTYVAGGATTEFTFTGLAASEGAYYFKVVAVNAAGEGTASEVVASIPGEAASPKILIVNGFDRLQRSQNPVQPYFASTVERQRPRQSNAFDYAVQAAAAIESVTQAVVDTTANEFVISGAVSLADYDAVIWMSGEESTANKTFDATEQALVTAYLSAGGKVFASGAEIGFELDGGNQGRTFYNNQLRADYVSDDANSYAATGAADSIFAGVSLTIDNGAQFYNVDFPDVISPFAGSTTAMNYGTGGVAAVQYAAGAGDGRVVTFGFPYESITDELTRATVMSRVLGYFGLETHPPRPPVPAPVEAVLDNDSNSPTYMETGSWSLAAGVGYNGGTYRFATSGAASTAKWQFTAPYAGTAQVFVQYKAGVNRASSASYQIDTGAGVQTATIDQKLNDLTWVPLGVFDFSAGLRTITLDAAASSGGSVVIADAVRVLLTAPPQPDFNWDQSVDGADVLLWQQGFGIASGATPEQGDANGDGAVDATDLAAWQANFGAGAVVAASEASVAALGIDPPIAATAAAGLVSLGAQPTGPLTGKIVYTSGGHGFEYEGGSTNGGFLTDRPEYNEIVEDFGNQEQMSLFAEYLFRAGATVVPMRPVGHQINEVVLDNDSAGVAYTGAWADVTTGSRWYDEDYGAVSDAVRYRFADANAGAETATATYTPNIPQAGFYPVYAWTSAGGNRTLQTYRVNHTGGSTAVKVDHSMVGNGWVYLGTYYFAPGSSPTSGSVTISNQGTAGKVVVADAIRFGNGMGDLREGPGGFGTGNVSGSPREDESSYYWLYRGFGLGLSPTTIIGTGNVSAPSNMAEYMNQNTNPFGSSVYISFHSNGTTGDPATATARGAIGLIDSDQATPHQSDLALFTGRQINQDMQALNGVFDTNWGNRTTHSSFGAFGEIDLGASAEMDATIVEVGFHDTTLDANMLRDPKVRDQIARSTYEATLEYFDVWGGLTSPVTTPSAPVNFRVESNASGEVTLAWNAGPTGVYGAAATSFRVYASTDGYGFDGGTAVAGGSTSVTLSGYDPATPYYFKLVAVNAGGESKATEVLAAVPSGGDKQILIVNGFDRSDRNQNARYSYYSPAGNLVDRVWSRYNNSYDYVVQHATAIQAAAPGIHIASTSNEAVASGAVNLADYDAVVWILGEETKTTNTLGVSDRTFSSSEQTKVAAYLSAGGDLFLSGAEIGNDLDALGGGVGFYNNTLKADFVSDDAGTYNVTGVAGSIFQGLAFSFDNGQQLYDVNAPDKIAPLGGAIAALNYSTGGAAAIQFANADAHVVMLAFPFETITSAAMRTSVMQKALEYFATPFTPTPIDAVLDNDDGPAVYTETGSWSTAGAQGYNGLTYRFTPVGGAASAAWVFNAPYAGNAEVFVQFRAGVNRASSAFYQIDTGAGVQTATVDQKANDATWVSLGTFNFTVGAHAITLDAAQSTGGSVIVADVVRVVLTPPAPPANPDFNDDSFIDGADLLNWQRGLGIASGATREQGDANGDGAVDDADLAAWQAGFNGGEAAVAGFAASSDAVIAEAVDAAATNEFSVRMISADSATAGLLAARRERKEVFDRTQQQLLANGPAGRGQAPATDAVDARDAALSQFRFHRPVTAQHEASESTARPFEKQFPARNLPGLR